MCPIGDIDDIIKIHSPWRWFPTWLPATWLVSWPCLCSTSIRTTAPLQHHDFKTRCPSSGSITKLNEKLFLCVVSSAEEACVTVCPCVYMWHILWLLMAAMTGFRAWGLGFALDSFPISGQPLCCWLCWFLNHFVTLIFTQTLWGGFFLLFFRMKYARYSKSKRTFGNMALTYSMYRYALMVADGNTFGESHRYISMGSALTFKGKSASAL